MSADPSMMTRIVLVDDDAAVRNAVAFALVAEGFEVEAFATGEAALAEEPDADCYIVDERLGGMRGTALIAALRSRNVARRALIITTHPGTDLVRTAYALGVPIVEKPLLGSALMTALGEVLARA